MRGIVGWGVVLAGCGASSRSFEGDDVSGDADADVDGDADADADADADSDSDTDEDGAPCSDVDGDRYGVGDACEGSDCDDSNPEVWDRSHCEKICAEISNSPGCACNQEESPEPEICYEGPGGTLGLGPCRAGLVVCNGDTWGPCDGEVLPTDEVCNGLDDDCDGEADEGAC